VTAANQAQQHEHERAIALSGSFNFRDLGGYETTDGRRVKWRRLFRADGLSRLTTADLDVLGHVCLATVLVEHDAYPAVFHCSAGKDRTGILAAIVLGLLGVPDDVIVADYTLSAAAMERMIAYFRAEKPDRAEALESYAPALVAAAPETMASFIDAIETNHGGFVGLVTELGVPDAADRLRDLLLD